MFRFAICNEMFEGYAHEDAFRRIREVGYDAVELAPFALGKDPAGPTDAETGQVAGAARSAGLPICGLHWLLSKTSGFHLTSADRRVRKRTAEILKSRAKLCAELGGSIMVLGSPQQRSLEPGVSLNQATDNAVEVLGELAPALEKLGVTLCIEPLSGAETDFINTADEAAALASLVGSRNVQIVLDVKAMSSESTPITDIIDRHLEHTAHFHANDPNLRGPGFGDLDFTPILKALTAGGYSGCVSVEVFNYDPDPETIAIQSLRYLQSCLPEGNN